MTKELFVSSTPHETRVGMVEDDQLAEIYLERENEYTLAGSIYKGRVTRVLPGMQSAFVDIGLERDAFLYVSDFMELHEEDEVEEIPAKGVPAQASQPNRKFSQSGTLLCRPAHHRLPRMSTLRHLVNRRIAIGPMVENNAKPVVIGEAAGAEGAGVAESACPKAGSHSRNLHRRNVRNTIRRRAISPSCFLASRFQSTRDRRRRHLFNAWKNGPLPKSPLLFREPFPKTNRSSQRPRLGTTNRRISSVRPNWKAPR